MSLATELSDKGFLVEIIEKKHYLGGRASNTIDNKMQDPVPIGPHVFVSAYNFLKAFLKKVKADEEISWQRRIFLELYYKGSYQVLKTYRLPGALYMLPWLLFYRFVGMFDKLSNIRLMLFIQFSSKEDLEIYDSQNVLDFLKSYGVTENFINKFWRLFVLSLLNLPLELCSAGEFCLLLKEWTNLKTPHFGFTKVGLGDLYTIKSQEYLENRGAKFHFDSEICKIDFSKSEIEGIQIKTKRKKKKIFGDIYVSTLNPMDLRNLLPEEILFSNFFRGLNVFEPVPYISVNLWFDKKITNKKFWALVNDEETSKYMNTDFYDQSNIYKSRKNQSYITSNIIYSKAYEKMTDKEIVKKTLEELKESFPKMKANIIHYHIHRIPYVIYAPFPGVRQYKPERQTPYKNFYLTGDWTVKEIPQCMEAAVRSGYECAELIEKNHPIK